VEFPTLAKPWRDLERYRELRLREAVIEARLALEFLEEGLVRNAAGKAFQAWKAYLAHLAAGHREELKREFPGARRVRAGEEVAEIDKADLVIALAPTGRMLQIAALLARLGVRDVVEPTVVALELRRYQYNGPDSESFLSGIPDERSAAVLVCTLAGRVVGGEDVYKRVCGPSRS
jgi:hypothetical protein